MEPENIRFLISKNCGKASGHMVLRGKSQFFDFYSWLDPTGLWPGQILTCISRSDFTLRSRVVLQAEQLPLT